MVSTEMTGRVAARAFRTWVQVHEVPEPSVPRAYPSGIYDVGRDTGFVKIGAISGFPN